MADINRIAEQIVLAAESGSVSTIDSLLTTKTFKARGSQSINPSIPARFDFNTGKVVILDLDQHTKECAELIKNEIVPLEQGYIYIDEQAFNALLEDNRLPAGGDFKQYSSTTKVTAQFSSMLDSTQLEEFRKKLKEDLFVKTLSSVGSRNVILTGSSKTSLETAKKDLEEYIDKTQVSPSSIKVFLIYKPSSAAKDLSYYTDSIVYTFDIKNNNFTVKDAPLAKYKDITITNVTSVTSENLEQLLQTTHSQFVGKQQAGHLKAVKTSEVEELLNLAIELSNNSIIKASKKAYSILKEYIDIIREDLEELKRIDKLFGTARSYYSPDFNVTLANLRAGANQLGNSVIFTATDSNGRLITRDGAALEFLFSIEGVTTPEAAQINAAAKGSASTQAVINRIKKAWDKAAEIALKNLAIDSAEDKINETGSHSLLQTVLIRALGRIFNAGVDKKIELRKGRKNNLFFKNFFKKSKPRSFTKASSKKVSYRKKNVYKEYGTQQTTQNIVPVLNAEIKRYVLEQMSYPSLENRSGRFASSVRVLSAEENAAVQYTYMKSPYQVFSQARGKSAWNDREERDPAQIIDKAIKKIGMDKFGKVFRTEER
jgi:hypothetical protein